MNNEMLRLSNWNKLYKKELEEHKEEVKKLKEQLAKSKASLKKLKARTSLEWTELRLILTRAQLENVELKTEFRYYREAHKTNDKFHLYIKDVLDQTSDLMVNLEVDTNAVRQ